MREYAPFFEWFQKDRKELGVVEALLGSLNQTSGSSFCSPRIQHPDPPDCICFNAEGGLVAVEVAEVVCEEAARLTAQGEQVMRVWRPEELKMRVVDLLDGKDGKTFHGGPYADIITCLFTDEPMLTLEHVNSELGNTSFGPYKQLTSAFLVLSYDPSTKSYPVVTLRVSQ